MLAISLGVLFVATLIHAASLFARDRGMTHSFRLHLWLTTPLWLAVIILAVAAGIQPSDFEMNAVGGLLGWLVGISGLGITVWHFALVGLSQTMGSRFFRIPPRVRRDGLYAIMQNPMYIGFTLALFGLSVARGSFTLLVLGIASIFALHLFLAPIENRGIHR